MILRILALFGLSFSIPAAFAQCAFQGTVNAPTSAPILSPNLDNRPQACPSWSLQYTNRGSGTYTTVTITVKGAPDNNGTPGAFVPLAAQNGYSNPATVPPGPTNTVTVRFQSKLYAWLQVSVANLTGGTGTFSWTLTGTGGNPPANTSYTTSQPQKAMQSVTSQDFDDNPKASCTGPTHDDTIAGNRALAYLRSIGGGRLQFFNANLNSDGSHTCWFNSATATNALLVPQGSHNITLDFSGVQVNTTIPTGSVLSLIGIFPIANHFQEVLTASKCAMLSAPRGQTYVQLSTSCGLLYPFALQDAIFIESGARISGTPFNTEINQIASIDLAALKINLVYPLSHTYNGADGQTTTGIADVEPLMIHNTRITGLHEPPNFALGNIALVQSVKTVVDNSYLACGANNTTFETGLNVDYIIRDTVLQCQDAVYLYQLSTGQSHILFDNVTFSLQLSTPGSTFALWFSEGVADVEVRGSRFTGNGLVGSVAGDLPIGVNIHDNFFSLDAGASASEMNWAATGPEFQFRNNIVVFSSSTAAKYNFNGSLGTGCQVTGNTITALNKLSGNAVFGVNATDGCNFANNTITTGGAPAFEVADIASNRINIHDNFFTGANVAGEWPIAFDESTPVAGPLVTHNSFQNWATAPLIDLTKVTNYVIKDNQYINALPFAPLAPITVNGSTSGSMVCNQPLFDATLKTVICKLVALAGTASYTFPVPFSAVPGANSTLATTISATAVTITGATSTTTVTLSGN